MAVTAVILVVVRHAETAAWFPRVAVDVADAACSVVVAAATN